MNLKSYIKNNFIVGQSPMDGVTDEAFRLTQNFVVKPDVTFTEFVSAEGISRGGVRLYDQLLYSSSERPIIGQIFGKDPDSFYKAAVILSHLGFDGIDLNMGCPAKTVTQHGSGAALIAQPELASQLIISARQGINDYFSQKIAINDIGLKQASLNIIDRNTKYSNIVETHHGTSLQIPKPTLSVKTRIGITENVIDSWIPHLLSHKLDFITLHGRTLKQGYAGLANWEAIAIAAKLAHQKNTLLWGNGDVQSHQQAVEYGQEYGVDGVLIGRASMGNPWVFNDTTPTLRDRFSLMCYHAKMFTDVFPYRQFDPLRRHFLLYTSGHPHAKILRDKIVHLNSLTELYALEDAFLTC
jgi:tRNA-dihydrouridine synthase B